MPEINGWHLPRGDGYFVKFVQGVPPKKNGFQRDHLLAAFKHVRAWNIAIDVGAHVGFWTTDMAEKFDAVYAFEPSPLTYDCLVKNMAEHTNIILSNAAIGDKSRTCEIIDDRTKPGNTGAYFIDPRSGSGSINMVRLDDLAIPGCDLLKIDVEGFEYQALKGAEKLIRKRKPVIIMECDKYFSYKRYRISRHEAMLLVLGWGYKQVERMRPDRVFIPE